MGNCDGKEAGNEGELSVDPNDKEQQDAALKIQQHYRNKKHHHVNATFDQVNSEHAPSHHVAKLLT